MDKLNHRQYLWRRILVVTVAGLLVDHFLGQTGRISPMAGLLFQGFVLLLMALFIGMAIPKPYPKVDLEKDVMHQLTNVNEELRGDPDHWQLFGMLPRIRGLNIGVHQLLFNGVVYQAVDDQEYPTFACVYPMLGVAFGNLRREHNLSLQSMIRNLSDLMGDADNDRKGYVRNRYLAAEMGEWWPDQEMMDAIAYVVGFTGVSDLAASMGMDLQKPVTVEV